MLARCKVLPASEVPVDDGARFQRNSAQRKSTDMRLVPWQSWSACLPVEQSARALRGESIQLWGLALIDQVGPCSDQRD